MEPRKLSAFFPHISIDVPLDAAWAAMIDYNAWNPSFAFAKVTTVKGTPGAEGEVVHIDDFDADGNLRAEFYAETVRIVERHHFTWAVYPAHGDDFLNFVDFELLERPGGVEFYIQYFAQTRTADADLPALRAAHQQSFEALTVALKTYCETGIPVPPA
jgi:hypothetical protein